MTDAGVLVVGYGNSLRGDDGIGWHAAELLASDPRLADARVLARHQLTPELAVDVSRAALVVLVDASADGDPGAVSVRRVEPRRIDPATWSHHLDPESLAGLAKDLYGGVPPIVLVSVAAGRSPEATASPVPWSGRCPRSSRWLPTSSLASIGREGGARLPMVLVQLGPMALQRGRAWRDARVALARGCRESEVTMTALILLALGVLILVVGTIHVVLVRPRINQWGASDQVQLSTRDRRLKPTSGSQPRDLPAAQASIELYWLPLGAGGWFVKMNGRIWEAVHALLEGRRPLDLYHSALVVALPEGRFVIENCWPIPDADGRSRGVVVQGPVASRQMGRFRMFRYEVRRWRDGVIADADEAVASPQLLSHDPAAARRLMELVGSLPSPVWGRDELGTGEMWNSNSVIAWLLARSGLPTEIIRPPAGGRAPGWQAGLTVAHRQPPTRDPVRVQASSIGP